MFDLARRHATDAGVTNVEFPPRTHRSDPLPDALIDLVITLLEDRHRLRPNPRSGRHAARPGDRHLARSALPARLEELATLGRTLHWRRDDVLAYCRPRLQRAHRSDQRPPRDPAAHALGFRRLVNHRIRSLLHCGNLAV